jgi:uncharacterized cupin superfamily protein
MNKFGKDDRYENLDEWPFDNPVSDYRILRGSPRASGKIEAGSNQGQHRMGVWRCSEGAFECTETGDELQTIVSGRLILTRVGGDSIDCGPGDSVFTRKGERVVWDIQQEVTKIFYSFNRDGLAD